MKLNRVEIKNFRSIRDVKVEFEPTCRVLIGINESGKTNILNALALLSDKYKPKRVDDLREELQDEERITESYVQFIFSFEKKESDKLLEVTTRKVLSKTKQLEVILDDGKKKTLKRLCTENIEGLYVVDVLEETKSFRYWSMTSNGKLDEGWKKPTNNCPADFEIEYRDSRFKLTDHKFIYTADFPDIPEEYLEDVTFNDLYETMGESIIIITEQNLPNVLFWEYDESNLLPSFLNINDFSNNPDSCPPLKNMFNLANIDDIKTSIADARKGTDNQFQNYLNRIAAKTTKHFRDIWNEYKGIEFSLRLNADRILPGVKEKNIHDFARRSDGFKRFVTFLIMISSSVRTGVIQDTLLLIDDPDSGLHPSGERYLRDELIKISKTNYVVYSTHSIFMIDSGDIPRHYIVKKKDEITSIEAAKDSNVTDEEVLYNAIGHSIFSILKENNIIFEGWKDKHLFLVALENASSGIKEKFKSVGICHAKGAKSIKMITPMIELANRKCLIISDSDKPAKEQRKIYKSDKGYGDWKIYQDIDSSIEAITGEDFVKNDFIAEQIQLVISNTSMPTFSESLLPIKEKLTSIYTWLTKNGMTKDQADVTIKNLKESIFNNIKPQNIEDTYTKLLDGIHV